MQECNRGFIIKRQDGSEIVNYNNPAFPTYIHQGWLLPGVTWADAPHFHDDIEVVSVIHGQMAYCVNGTKIVLNQGDSLFINSNQLHYSTTTNDDKARYNLFIFHPRILCASNEVERKYIKPISEDSSVQYILFKKGTPNADKLYDLSFDIIADVESEFYTTMNYYEFWSILLHWQRENINTSSNYSDNQINTLKIMLTFIHTEYMNPITLNDIAMAGSVSKTFCNNLFHKYTSQTPIEALTRFRVSKVAELLRTTDMSMTDLAFETGFSGASYMSEMFKRYYGVSPREYKKSPLFEV